jgi:hypothetical protein
MAGRILTLQRQARELGRLRTGYTQGNRPMRSKTWVVTSHARHYVEAAAGLWGGNVEQWQPLGNRPQQWRVITDAESIDAIMPPGDPLSQYNEMWSKGGCQRRCDGITESISDRPCLCLAQFGEDWYLQPKGDVCSATTRLNVMLPDMPDLGVWRAETHSFYAANEWAGQLDMVLSGTGGKGFVPVALRIEPRQRVAGGKTKNFPVVVVEIRGITPRQALAGPLSTEVALDPTAPRLAIAAPAPDYEAEARNCKSPDEVQALWRRISEKDAPRATPELLASFKAIAEDIGRGKEPDAPGEDDAEDEAVEAEFVDPEDPDDMWGQFDAAGLGLGLSPEDTARGFEEKHQVHPRKAKAALVWEYIAALRKQRDDAVA